MPEGPSSPVRMTIGRGLVESRGSTGEGALSPGESGRTEGGRGEVITSLSRGGRAFWAEAWHAQRKGGTEEPGSCEEELSVAGSQVQHPVGVSWGSREKTQPERRQGQTQRSLEFQAKKVEPERTGS